MTDLTSLYTWTCSRCNDLTQVRNLQVCFLPLVESFTFFPKKKNIGLPGRARVSYFLIFIWFPPVETGL
jgi:hypothetical protein